VTRLHSKESDVQRGILDLLAAERIYALRLNTGSGFVNGRPIYHHSGGRGVADIVAFPEKVMGGLSMGPYVLWIEIKSSSGRQTLDQKSFEETVTQLGMHYLVARGSEDVLKWLEEHR